MEKENPYQSPNQVTESEPNLVDLANFYRVPTWRFWLLWIAILPGIATLALVAEISQKKGNEEDARIFEIINGIAASISAGLLTTILFLWRTPSLVRAIPSRQGRSACCLAAIGVLTLMAALSILISAIAITHILYEGKLYFEAREDTPFFIGIFCAAVCCVSVIPLGIWLVYDFLGKSRRWRFQIAEVELQGNVE